MLNPNWCPERESDWAPVLAAVSRSRRHRWSVRPDVTFPPWQPIISFSKVAPLCPFSFYFSCELSWVLTVLLFKCKLSYQPDCRSAAGALKLQRRTAFECVDVNLDFCSFSACVEMLACLRGKQVMSSVNVVNEEQWAPLQCGARGLNSGGSLLLRCHQGGALNCPPLWSNTTGNRLYSLFFLLSTNPMNTPRPTLSWCYY